MTSRSRNPHRVRLAQLFPEGFQFTFGPDRVLVARVDLAEHDELGVRLPLWQRVKTLVAHGALPTSAIAERLEVPEASIRQVLKRDTDNAERRRTPSMFTRVDGGRIGLAERKAS